MAENLPQQASIINQRTLFPLCYLSLILVLIILSFSACKQRNHEHTYPVKPVKSETKVLLLVSGYGSRYENFTLEELTRKLQQDTLNTYILKNIRNDLVNIIPIIKAKSVDNLNDVPMSDSVLLLTDLQHLYPSMKVLKINDKDFFEESSSYPLVSNKQEAVKIWNNITLLNLTGVTAITRGVCNAIERNGMDYLIENIKPYFDKADYVHVSNEVSFKKDCECAAHTMRFCSKEENFKLLLNLNVNIVELTGNHNRDYGNDAYHETLKWYKERNIKTFGGGDTPEEANTPLVITLKDSTRLGFIGFNEICPNGECADIKGECGANRYDTAKAKAVLRKMRTKLKCNYIIASVQFSEIDAYLPHAAQIKICDYLLSCGADMVYGSQAHQVQQVAFNHGKPVFYGLGNFLFDQVHKTGLRQAYFLQLYFYKGNLIQARPVFTFYQNDYRLHIATKTETEAIMKEIFSERLLYYQK
jgi:poly-gamma-glutamate capsule biosynthesis protein CapA/YwtB (metallophosphatase superfamily)